MPVAYIGLGANVGDVLATFKMAINEIGRMEQTQILACSSYYQSAPWGGIPQPDYLNAVLKIETQRSPNELLQGLHRIERQHGRQRETEQRWGARRLDCDILLYGEHDIRLPNLHIPHPRMSERAFVLIPLFELDNELQIPGFGAIRDMIKRLPEITGLRKLTEISYV